MTILQYVEYGFSMLLLIGGFVFCIIAMYVARYVNQKSIRLYVRYSIFGGVAIGFASWLLMLIANGFFWEHLVLIVGITLVFIFFTVLNGYILGMRTK